jgi:hypothetical protein
MHLLPFNPFHPMGIWTLLFSTYAYYALFALYCLYSLLGFRVLTSNSAESHVRQVLWGLLAVAVPVVGGCAVLLLHRDSATIRARVAVVALGLLAIAIVAGYISVQASFAIAPEPST